MTKLTINRKKQMLGSLFIVALIFVTQVSNTSIQGNPDEFSYSDFSDIELISDIKSSTSRLSSLFNDELGIFVWNVQDPLNLSRYGDFSDLSNSDEGLDHLDFQIWLDGLAQDISMQYLILKNNVQLALDFVGDQSEEVAFNREWIFLTESIISWLYHRVAINDQLLSILDSLSSKGEGFDAYWDTLIRPKYNEFIGEEIALLPDTLVLGSKLLRAVEFMPYFSYYDKYSILLLSELASNWWYTINTYALFDPKFSVTGIGDSYIHETHSKWIGWQKMTLMARNGSFQPLDIYDLENQDFQNYIYTSPQIANLYLTYIKKVSARDAVIWDEKHQSTYPIENQQLELTFNKIINDYAEHITYVHEQVVYVFESGPIVSWKPLSQQYSGYSYVWDDYFVDGQDSDNDLHQYRYDGSPLKTIGLRTFQGAGDIRGLLDVYNVLSHGFSYDIKIQFIEQKAILILEEILDAQRSDDAFVFSPYFGTAVDTNVMTEPLINDGYLLYPSILPPGVNQFTGTMSVMQFLLDAEKDIVNLGLFTSDAKNNEFGRLKDELLVTLIEVGDFLIENINTDTMGIAKQSVIGNHPTVSSDEHYYITKSVKVTINLQSVYIPESELPNWIYHFEPSVNIGRANIYHWDFQPLLMDLYFLTEETKYVDPLFESLLVFQQDFSSDEEYQITSICGGEDAIVRLFFTENYIVNDVDLSDNTGLFGSSVPYYYRSEVLPVTSAFASETPQKLTGIVLRLLPPLLEALLNDPMNQIVLVGFVSGIVIAVAVIYIKRPKHQ